MSKHENFDERQIEERLDLVLDVQFFIQRLLNEGNISRTELATRMGISKARLSQIMKAEANPTLYTLADVFYALGEKVRIERVDAAAAQVVCDWTGLDDSVASRRDRDRSDSAMRARISGVLRQRPRAPDNDDSVAWVNVREAA